jgi:DNA-binding MarR family transcriptional regulator
MSSEPTTAPSDDSVDRDLVDWLAELPRVDPGIEAARMRLLRIGRQSEQMLAGIAAQHGLTLGDWETLSVLRRSGPPYAMTPSGLMAALGVTSGTVSVRIERLQKAGLVEPADSSGDGRSRPVRLTGEGTRRWQAATDARTAFEHRLFTQAFTPGQVLRLNTLLRVLMLELEAELGPPPRRPDGQG